MPIPARYLSSFSPATLKTVETHASQFRVAEPLFFRGAYTANVTEHERRKFAPVIVVDAARVLSSRCTCSPRMRPNDLCRHLAVLVDRMAAEDGALPSEKFEQSVWRAIAFASFSDGREIRADDGDPREQMLRRYVLTEQEQALLNRGSGSARLLFEASPWYRWSKEMFLRGAEDARLELHDGAASLVLAQQRVPIPPSAVEHVVASAPEIVTASGFEITPGSLTPSLRIELTSNRTLRFTPVLLGNGGTVLEREALPKFGRFYLAGNRFASPAMVPPMFVEQSAKTQTTLFEMRPSAGMPYDRETVIAEDEVFAFVQRHREELAALPATLAPEAVRNARPVRLDDDVVFEFATPHKEFLEIEITFRAAAEMITAAEIARARRDGIRALVRGSLWIDVTDPQFGWLDDATIGPQGHVLVTKLELLRIRGSLRGNAVFRGDPSCERVFRLFDEIQTDADAPSPASFGIDLYGYQQTGYQWLWLLQQNGFGGLLCDDMGLGKTHQAIALIRALTHVDPSQAVLVVCPTSLIDHWREKLARYIPGVEVTLTTYGLVRSRFEQFRGKRFDLVVLDEMQTIKNADTATHHALRGIDKRIAIGLTGTPIENHEGELKTLLDFVVPGYLPKHVDDRMTLQRLVRPFVLRRTKAQVLTQLPPKIVDKRFCELTGEQRLLYRRVLESRAKPLRAKLLAGQTVSYVHIFAALNYLKQICNHPASVGGGFGGDVTSGKWDMFLGLLDECMASGLKVVVFSQYLQMLAIIEDHLFRNGIGYASIKGATRERGAEIARFREDPDCRVFTASLRAGGLGIDLTSASVVIHYDRWWNQAREDQATDRVHRLGQSKGVQVIKLITRNTIEEKIDALITQKGSIASDVIRVDDPSLVKTFTRDELDDLLSEA
ncbi:MAG TPA: DEAD/DEAH box helicase [Thermoanaerobaculia bacterium]|jgi:superfamily II DNA or RNA helicase|nr:DEAD/DEAH box helicase [Thermoanaerobaculia bacterium]